MGRSRISAGRWRCSWKDAGNTGNSCRQPEPAGQGAVRLAQHPWVPAGSQVRGLSFGGADSAGRVTAEPRSPHRASAPAMATALLGCPGGQEGRWVLQGEEGQGQGEAVPPGPLGVPIACRGTAAQAMVCAEAAGWGFSFPPCGDASSPLTGMDTGPIPAPQRDLLILGALGLCWSWS